ncbi:hypothetical protein GALMADRAFT_148864 [Galerina marginata CBS 339.88]|uniref:Uncharacterized protein n=1 Tax=Galerina marginata (strain CBS 339.88) TaxID=685588 RepID=A0A067S351_GALM3|nr:hypothetical protein GALMADRAFT_148864 [Galerina marginata CBS 339.88]
MPKRKVKENASSSEENEKSHSSSENETSDNAFLSDQSPPPITPRRSKRVADPQAAIGSLSKSKKKNATVAAFTPSPEQKSPKKPRHISKPKPPTTPTKNSKLRSPIVLIQTKKKITKALKEETASESDSGSEKELDSEDKEDTQEDEDQTEDDEEEEEEEEDENEDEKEDSDANFIDDEAEENTSSEENEPPLTKSKGKTKASNPQRQKIVNAAIKKSKESKTKEEKSFDKRKGLLKDTGVYLEDLITKDAPERRPQLRKCQIYDKDLVDSFLAKTYKDLPKLPSGYTNNRYLPAGEAQEPMMYVSELLPDLTKISKKYLLDLFTFISDKGTSTVNLSRIEPCDLIAKKPDTGSIYPLVTLRDQKTPALCLSLICVDEDYTRHAKDINGSPYKILTGVIQTMEYERLVATLCMVYKVPGIKTMMSNNRWSFSSRPGSSNNRAQNSYGHAGPSRSVGTKKLSPANAQQAQFKNSKWKLGYTFDENIPILDGRSTQIDLPKGLRKVAETLPAFPGDIPTGSLTLVGYTTLGYNSQKSPDELTIGTNICWAVVLATPQV